MSSRLADAPRPAELVWWLALRAARAQTRGDWPAARHATERALAPVFAVLDEAERAEFAASAVALQAAVNPG